MTHRRAGLKWQREQNSYLYGPSYSSFLFVPLKITNMKTKTSEACLQLGEVRYTGWSRCLNWSLFVENIKNGNFLLLKRYLAVSFKLLVSWGTIPMVDPWFSSYYTSKLEKQVCFRWTIYKSGGSFSWLSLIFHSKILFFHERNIFYWF